VRLVRVAGGIVWRETSAGSRIAVVHRRKRDDWSLPKGRVDAGESFRDAARREIAEETGCVARLGRFAGAKLFLDRPEPKLVLYWHARVVHDGALSSQEEVDEVAWLSRREALSRLDHESDRRLLLRTLAGRTGYPLGPGGAWSAPAPLAADELRQLVIVDSGKADDALPSVLGLIARAAAVGAGPEARRTVDGRLSGWGIAAPARPPSARIPPGKR
jgi:8-oxo-dGTP diphosphatase